MPEWTEGQIQVEDTFIHYYRTGGDKPPVVLLHGFSDSGRCWTPIANVLEADYDLVMPDARGHGHSGGPGQSIAPEVQAADVAQVIQQLQLQKPALIGHSMGANTAAFTTALYPQLVRSLVLEDPPWFRRPASAPPPSENDEPQPAWIFALLNQSPAERLAACRRDNPAWPEDEFGPWEEAKEQFNRETARVSSVMLSTPWQEAVSRITCPTLLLRADTERGAIVTLEIAQEVSTLLQHGRVVHIANAGHNIRRDQHKQFLQVISAFLKETT